MTEHKRPAGYKEQLAALHLKRRYNITPATVATLLAGQKHRCPLCRNPLTRRNQAVDHNHETGIVRGVLCRACNGALGQLGDNEASIQRVMDYLRGSG